MEDFGARQESAVRLLNQFLHDQDGPDGEELEVGATRQDQQFAILAVESLRRMRGIEPKIADPLFGHWAQTSEDDTVEWPLLSGGDSGPQRSLPISVAGLIRRLSKVNQTTTVVHWIDAIRRQLSPTELLIPHAGSDAATMLDELLVDRGLQVRQADQHRWWIGTASTYDRAKVVVWTKPLGAEADTLQRRIANVMAGRDSFRVAIDPESRRAIMMLPRYIVRQLPKIHASVAAK